MKLICNIQRKIKVVTGILLLIFVVKGYGQNCKIEFYLLKKEIPVVINSMDFHATRDDLEDTAFITNDEITSFSIKKNTTKDSKTVEQHFFHVSQEVVERINKLEIPLFPGKQFVLLVDGEIIYGGYFWNFFSSWGCSGIVAFAIGDKIIIERKLPDYGYENDMEAAADRRKNPILFDCLQLTNRMVAE